MNTQNKLIFDLANIAALSKNLNLILDDQKLKTQKLDKTVIRSIADLIKVLNAKGTVKQLSPKEITDVSDLGLSLLQSLLHEYSTGELENVFNEAVIALAYWVSRHAGTINNIEITVHALASIANVYHQKPELESLYEAATFIVGAIAEKDQVASDDLQNAWRLLNINYAIIATRTHTPELMESAFVTLVKNIPKVATGFFAQGMSEMQRLNYPEHVRQVMQRYHHKYST